MQNCKRSHYGLFTKIERCASSNLIMENHFLNQSVFCQPLYAVPDLHPFYIFFQNTNDFTTQPLFFRSKKNTPTLGECTLKKQVHQKITSQNQHKKRTKHNFLTVLRMVLLCPSVISLHFNLPEQIDFGMDFINIQFLFTD